MTGSRNVRLCLVGAGHAHLAVLARLTVQKPADTEISLLCAERYQRYSGVLPAWMAGYASESAMCIDIAPLCQAAGVQWIQDNLLSLDATQRSLVTQRHVQFEYDLLSLNTGADSKVFRPAVADNRLLLTIRPLAQFVREWPLVLAQAKQQAAYTLVVVGAGAAAVELAMAAQVALQRISAQHGVILVCGTRLLPDFRASQVQRVVRQLQRHQIQIVYARATGMVDKLLLSNGQQLRADRVIIATGTAAPDWTSRSSLACDADGFIQVGATHQSVSHPEVFAVGDVCQRVDQPVAHSGVHAVHAGKVLAHNLLAYLHQQSLKPYRPKTNSLYLLSCGTPYAIGFWGKYAIEGAWVWRLKQRIDQGFVQRYQRIAPTRPSESS